MTLQALQIRGPAPYASPKTIIDVIERFRAQGLPQPLTVDSIQRVSVNASLAPRTIQALRLLSLIDENGKVTDQFEDLRRAPTPEFKPLLVEWLRAVYAEVFTVVDPASATFEQVHDAFRQFHPPGQKDRMVALFLRLLEYAEYSDSLPKARALTPSSANGSKEAKRPPARKSSLATPPAPTLPKRPDALDNHHGHQTTVDLGEAGLIALLVDVNPLLLSKADREFLFDLIDRMEEHRQASKSPHPAMGAAVPDTSEVSTP
jgi:hypothetical protein